MRWLNDPALAGPDTVESVWGRTFSGYPNFKSKLIDPSINLYVSTGLDRNMLARKDGTGMRYVIGLLLWIDTNKGGKALGDLLWNMDSTESTDLYAGAKALIAPRRSVSRPAT